MSTNTVQVEREVSKGCPQGSCFGKGVWNTQYNTLLNLEFGKQIKKIALADELLVSVKTEIIREAENNKNLETNKISIWTKNNKIRVKEQKSNVMSISQWKRKEKKEITIYVNCKPLEHVQKIK
jgi:HD superfamily phosphohydrolase